MWAIVFIAVYALCNSVMDALNFNFSKSIFNSKKLNANFWNPQISWRNKYKDNDPSKGDRFFLSSTLFVGFTDAWHLFKQTGLISLGLAIVLYNPIVNLWVDFLLLQLVRGVFFTVSRMIFIQRWYGPLKFLEKWF